MDRVCSRQFIDIHVVNISLMIWCLFVCFVFFLSSKLLIHEVWFSKVFCHSIICTELLLVTIMLWVLRIFRLTLKQLLIHKVWFSEVFCHSIIYTELLLVTIMLWVQSIFWVLSIFRLPLWWRNPLDNINTNSLSGKVCSKEMVTVSAISLSNIA